MRTRLIIVFLVPLVGILLVLGGAYAWSSARSVQQSFATQQLADLSYFVSSARQALIAENTTTVASEITRYTDLYDAQVAILDRSGTVIASGGLGEDGIDESLTPQIDLALSGRRGEPVQSVLPWSFGEAVIVEPVYDDGRVVGAVLISESMEVPRNQIIAHWAFLLAVSSIVVLVLSAIIVRLANWVLRPMVRVDEAMVAIEQGEMHARIADDTGPPEMQRMIRIFNSMAEEIERVVSRQQEFAMNASHELRNPLGALLMRVEYLATGLDESWDEDVEKTREEARRMTRILETLLSLARGERRNTPFAVVDLAEIAEDRVRAWREVARERGVSFTLETPGEVCCPTDRTAVESALDAIIDNALKYAPRGSPVDLTVESDESHCRISVRDHGPGLTPEEIAQVTSRFWRSARDDQVQGSGLGLAIASDLLATLGGEVIVSGPEGAGLQVSLSLPRNGGDASPEPGPGDKRGGVLSSDRRSVS